MGLASARFGFDFIGDIKMERGVKEKSTDFAVRIVKLNRFLRDEKKERILSDQILRSGTSIGANLAESECAISKNDFLNKLYIALKECNETLYWLDVLYRSGYLSQTQYHSLYSDADEIKKMLSSSTATLKQKLSNHGE